jgi:hypothetical protein
MAMLRQLRDFMFEHFDEPLDVAPVLRGRLFDYI